MNVNDIGLHLPGKPREPAIQREIDVTTELPFGDFAAHAIGERVAFGADEQILDAALGKTVDEVPDLPGAAVEVPAGF